MFTPVLSPAAFCVDADPEPIGDDMTHKSQPPSAEPPGGFTAPR